MTDQEFFEEVKKLNDSPAKPSVDRVMPLIRHYCTQAHGLGGNLHIFVEDGNIDDDDIRFCKNNAIDSNDLMCRELCDVLLSMSKTQRKEICKMDYEMNDDVNKSGEGTELDLTQDSARLVGNGERCKCIVIMDVTDLTDPQRTEFVNRSMAALTKMGQKVMKQK